MRFNHRVASMTFVLFSCTVAYPSTCCEKNSITSHTYFSVRPQFQVGSPEHLSTTRVMREDKKGKLGMSVQATVFGGESTNSNRLGRFFMPFDCPKVVVDGEVKEGGTDLMPQHFNIFSVKYASQVIIDRLRGGDGTNVDPAFKSCISVKPRQSTIGVGLSYLAQFTIFKDWNMWFHVSAPIVNVENSMRLCESVIVAGEFYTDESRLQEVPAQPIITPIEGEKTNLDTNIRNMTQALSQSGWCFGKIDCRKRSQTELAFIQALIGSQWHKDDDCHAESSFGITIPTGNKTDACFVFDPVVGNGDHFGIISQTSGGVTLVDWESFRMTFEMDVVLQYLFKTTQRRSMDLKGKPWSRYIEIYANKAQATQAANLSVLSESFLASPGINVLTQKVGVEPGANASINFALLFDQLMSSNGFGGELGYNFYAKASESLNLKNRCCTKTAAIKDHFGNGIVNTVRDMTNNLLANEASFVNNEINAKVTAEAILADYDGRVINDCQLDLWSAAHPCSLSHTVYAMLNYQWNSLSTPVLFELGGSYEFSRRTSAALERWLLWGRIGIQF